MNRVEYRDHWLLTVNAEMVVRDLRSLLAHPALEISAGERIRYETDCAALSALLPSRTVREETTETSETPF